MTPLGVRVGEREAPEAEAGSGGGSASPRGPSCCVSRRSGSTRTSPLSSGPWRASTRCWCFPVRPRPTRRSSASSERARRRARVRFPGWLTRGRARRALRAGRLLRAALARGGLRPARPRGNGPGRAVRASNASSLPEVVGDAARLFDPHDPDELRRAIRRVLGDPELRKSLRKRDSSAPRLSPGGGPRRRRCGSTAGRSRSDVL